MKTRTQILIAVLMILAVLTGCASPTAEPSASFMTEVQCTENTLPTQMPSAPQNTEPVKESTPPAEAAVESTGSETVEDSDTAGVEETVPTGTEPPTNQQNPASEPTEPADPPAVLPPTETTPVETKPLTENPTEPPKETEPAPTIPTPTQPDPTESKPTQPEPTTPAPSTPAPTEPVGCSHEWHCIYHEEVGHWIAGVICDCGWTAYGNPDTLVGLWNAHSASYPAEESLFDHGGFGCVDDWIVDEPAYDEWVCRHCGEHKP